MGKKSNTKTAVFIRDDSHRLISGLVNTETSTECHTVFFLFSQPPEKQGGWTRMPSFKCKDIGMNCPFETSTPNREELMKRIKKHARNMHNITKITPEMQKKIEKAISR